MRPQLIATACTIVLFSGGCGDLDAPDPSDSLAGTYVATVFNVTPTGNLSIPASINGGTALSESMAGTATMTGTNVQFQQSADTFVRDLTWAFANNTLSVSNQTAGGAAQTLTLTRQ